jgi:hypothetical protein
MTWRTVASPNALAASSGDDLRDHRPFVEPPLRDEDLREQSRQRLRHRHRRVDAELVEGAEVALVDDAPAMQDQDDPSGVMQK